MLKNCILPVERERERERERDALNNKYYRLKQLTTQTLKYLPQICFIALCVCLVAFPDTVSAASGGLTKATTIGNQIKSWLGDIIAAIAITIAGIVIGIQWSWGTINWQKTVPVISGCVFVAVIAEVVDAILN